MNKAAVLLTIYALVTITMGVLAFMISPAEGAAKITALAIPGVIGLLTLACAVLCVIGQTPKPDGRPNPLGMLGVHAGLALPLIATLGIGFRAYAGVSGVLDARARTTGKPAETIADMTETALAGGDPTDQLKKDATAIEKDYLAMTLAGLTGLSLVTFTGLLLLRPKPRRGEIRSVPEQAGDN